MQLTTNNCAAVPSRLEADVFINTEMGALINTKHGVKINLHDGREKQTEGGTEFCHWSHAASIELQNVTLVRPDVTKDGKAQIIDQELRYTADLNFSVSVPFTHLEEKGLHTRLWEVEGAINKVEATMHASPFVVNLKTVLIIAAVVVLVVPILLMLCKKAIVTWNCNRRQRDKIIVPPK